MFQSVEQSGGRSSTVGVAAPLPSRDGSITLSSLIDLYFTKYTGRDPALKQRLDLWSAKIGHVTLAELDDDHVHNALREIEAQPPRYFVGCDVDGRKVFKGKGKVMANATVNRYRAALSGVISWSIKHRIAPKGYINCVRAVAAKSEKDNKRTRYLTTPQRDALLVACRASSWKMLYPLVLAAVTCGARKGELLGLRWRDVDLGSGTASLARTKNGESRTLILTPEVVDVLKLHEGAPGALVFASKLRPDVPFNVQGAWRVALKAAGVKDFRFHDLRHDAASRLAANGASLLSIGAVLGHKSPSVTARYAHLCVDQQRELVLKVMSGTR